MAVEKVDAGCEAEAVPPVGVARVPLAHFDAIHGLMHGTVTAANHHLQTRLLLLLLLPIPGPLEGTQLGNVRQDVCW